MHNVLCTVTIVTETLHTVNCLKLKRNHNHVRNIVDFMSKLSVTPIEISYKIVRILQSWFDMYAITL
jgi:hypothetical protein